MDLHPAAEALARAERAYQRDLARTARSKAARDQARRDRDDAILAAIDADPERSTTEIAARFGIVEGTVRAIKKKAATRQE